MLVVEWPTSFFNYPLMGWGRERGSGRSLHIVAGTVLSVYCLCRGVAFRDVELNTRIKTAISSLSNTFLVEMDYKALVRAVALEHGCILRSKLEEQSGCLYFFTYWL